MLDHFTDQVNKKKVRGEIIMTGKRYSTFPIPRTTEITQFADPTLTTSRSQEILLTKKMIIYLALPC